MSRRAANKVKGEQSADLASIFDADYLHFFGELIDEPASREADLVLKLLDPPPGATLVDAGCGHGRLAHVLAQRGFRVTAIDAVEESVRLGRERSLQEHLSVDYVVGDLRDAEFGSEFDAAVLWFGSFGYFEDEDNELVLRALLRKLRAGGRLLVDFPNPFEVVAQLRAGADTVVIERGPDLLIERHSFEATTSRLNTKRMTIRQGRVNRVDHQLRLYSAAEAVSLLDSVGFENVSTFGPNGGAFSMWSSRLIAVAQAP